MSSNKSIEQTPDELAERLDAAWPPLERALDRFLRKHLRSPAEVRDVIHDTYVRIRHSTEPIDNLEGYAITVAKNRAGQIMSDRSRRAPLDPEMIDGPLQWDMEERQALERSHELQRALEADIQQFNRLDERTKSMFFARLQDEPIESIAARMGVQPRTVHRHISRVRERFVQVLQYLRGDRDNE